ncbi:hypothetical protein LUZ60_009281 [Juncus effusus]|nr:hypothetical protein LUZ60_009281 [Juncus effusus]
MVLRKIESCIPPKELGFPFSSIRQALKKLEGYMKETEKILLLLQSFIATAQQSHSVSFKDWLEKTREVGKTVEELIREYASLVGKTEEQINNDNSNNHCDTQSWIKLSKKFKEVTFELQYRLNLKANISLVGEDSSKGEKDFDGSLRSEGASSSQSPSLNEGEMIGREEERSLLMNWLTEQHSERAIISIYGIGGVGKTTLARNIYEDNAIRSSFDCFLWVNASQNYQVEDLLKTILAQLVGSYQCAQGDSDVTNNKALAEKIRSYLKSQRYLIVLNDMWDSAAWLSLHRAFPALDCQTPNRVVITTRVEDVALVAGKDRAIRLKTLTEEQAQDLLFRKAFSNREIFNNWVQNPVLERILRKCQGLPLIIVAVGSILAQKDETEWKSFSDQFTMHLNYDPTMRGVVDVLNRSVTNLPSHLKNCFLHCSLFPESFYIIRKEITKMWVAEGFIKEGETDKTMDELADQYLLELVNHSLLQVAEERWDGKPKKLVMNNFVREVALNTSGKIKFGNILGDSYADKLDNGTRRLSIHNCRGNQIRTEVSQKLRSFLLFPSDVPYSFTNDVLCSCMLLRVLCLKGAKIKVLPDCLAKLFNLCYLNLRYSGIKQIPESFGDLHNLEVLDLRCEEPVSLSCGALAMLHKLRHLHVREGNREDCYSLSDACALESLQTLKTVVLTEDMASGLGNLIELRSLTVAAVAGSNAWDILDSLMQLSHLISLKIFNRSGACIKLAKCKAFPNLKKIHLVGPVDVDSTEIQSECLQKLKVLKMEKSGIQTDPLPYISLFPDLVVLCLQDAYQGHNLTFRQNWLPKLKSLTLSDMDQVVSIYIEAGTMRNLNFLRIYRLKRLKEVPKGIMYLESLHELFIEEVPQFYSVQEEGVRVLIDMVKFGSPRQKEMATVVLSQICEENEAYKTILEQEGVIKHSVSLSESSTKTKVCSVSPFN